MLAGYLLWGVLLVPEFLVIEKYSHVMHIVSDVRGKLKPGKDSFDVLKACFPAGTVSGAPKVRAMEIIEELETISKRTLCRCSWLFQFFRKYGLLYSYTNYSHKK